MLHVKICKIFCTFDVNWEHSNNFTIISVKWCNTSKSTTDQNVKRIKHDTLEYDIQQNGNWS